MSQLAGESVSDRAADFPSRRGSPAGAAGLREWLRSNLFLATASGPAGWRKSLSAVVCVAAGTAISLSRTVGPGSLNTVWIEDAKFLLSQGLSAPLWKTLQAPISGYYSEPARILTGVALQFPLSWVPGVMATFAALEYAMYGLVAYVASGPHLRSPWLRLLIAAPVCMIPLAYTQSNNDLVTVQFFALYGAFWTLLWIPGTRGGRAAAPVVMATVSFTAALSIVFFPLVAVRLFADRSKTAVTVAVVWFAGVLLQFSQTLEGNSKHYDFGSNGLFWLARNYVTRVVPRALFGERSLGGPGTTATGAAAPLHILNAHAHEALIVGAWVVLAFVLVLALRRFTNPDWPLLVTAALFSGAVFTEELFRNTPVVQPRYAIAPALLAYVAVVAALRPRLDPGARQGLASWLRPGGHRARAVLRCLPAAGFTALLAVAVALNFRVVNGRTTSPPWSNVVATARAECDAQPQAKFYRYTHEWWWVNIPCLEFRNYWQDKNPGDGTS